MGMKKGGRGFILIVTAPSGGGKGALGNHLLKTFSGIRNSVSTTTRTPRPGEEEGVHYFFVSPSVFEERIQEGAFLEWAKVFGHYYGTSRKFLEGVLRNGEDILLDIDWQGAGQVRQQMPPGDVVHVVILPPSREILHRRLIQRGQDSLEVIEKRMAQASGEISHWREADYLVINDDLGEAKEAMAAIVVSERLKRQRMIPKIGAILASFDLEEETES